MLALTYNYASTYKLLCRLEKKQSQHTCTLFKQYTVKHTIVLQYACSKIYRDILYECNSSSEKHRVTGKLLLHFTTTSVVKQFVNWLIRPANNPTHCKFSLNFYCALFTVNSTSSVLAPYFKCYKLNQSYQAPLLLITEIRHQ